MCHDLCRAVSANCSSGGKVNVHQFCAISLVADVRPWARISKYGPTSVNELETREISEVMSSMFVKHTNISLGVCNVSIS